MLKINELKVNQLLNVYLIQEIFSMNLDIL